MALWNRKRSRNRRVDRLHPEGAEPWYARLRTPRALELLGALAAFIVAALLIVQAPHPPLPVRKDEHATHPILARVDFDYVDRDVTADVRELTALLRVPGLYSPDARQGIAMRDGLLGMVAAVAKADALDKVPEAMRTAWKVGPEMFDSIKKALGQESQNLPAIQEAITKATAALAEPLDLPIVREEDYQRSAARLQRMKDLRNKLPAGLSPERAPGLEEPSPTILILLPAGDRPLALASVMTLSQTDRIQGRIGKLIETPLAPIFGDAGLAAIAQVMAAPIGPTLAYDQAQTENRRADVRASVAPVPVLRKGNTTLVEAGKEITDADLKILEQEQEAYLAHLGTFEKAMSWVGAIVILTLLIGVYAAYAATCQPNVARSVPRTVMLVVLCLIVLGVSKAVAQGKGPMELYTLLLATAAMVVTIAYTPALAMAMVWLLVLLVAIATRTDLDWSITALAGTSVAILSLGEINNRSKLIKVGALAGLAFFAARSALAFWRLDYGDPSFWNILLVILWPSFLYYCVGVAAGVIMLALLPFIERTFGIVTNISLLELCDVNQPALRRLALEAPGTYTHSLLIGTLAEAAAEAIGVNGLLARVGAYFHDIGKANKPRYFVENRRDGQENPHVGLAPAMSRLIILSHVKDGLEMAERLGLPPVIRQFITEHHGTTLMEYFYHEAQRHAETDGGPAPAESEYRYPGPKPGSPETAIVMLADAVEGATRSLKERSTTRVSDAVHDMVLKRLLDGQLDSCGLALSDLHKVEETLTKTLLSVYHGRVPYPSDRSSGETAGGGGKGEAGARGESGGEGGSETPLAERP